MFSNHMLYISTTRQEQRLGFVWLALLVISTLLHPQRSSALMEFLFHGANFVAVLVIFRSFLARSLHIPHTGLWQILRMALLGLVLAQLANLLSNDLLFYFFPQYFYYDEVGPHFANANKFLLEAFAGENFPLAALGTVLFAPVAEELLHRALVFGTLYRKSIALAYLVSVALYALLPTLPLFGNYPADYIAISFLQYVPIAVLFSWIYTRTESIYTPILAHILMNGVSIFTLR